MILATLSFYLFAAITVLAAVRVVTAQNPVHSVLFLILAFFSSAGLFILQGAEFVAMILIIVYVGAVAVLFLFVVMMLDINIVRIREGLYRYMGIGLAVGLVLVLEILSAVYDWRIDSASGRSVPDPTPDAAVTHNTQALGEIIYTKYVYLFQSAGLILLVAMIGAIVLTLRSRPGVKRQKIGEQVARDAETTVVLKKVQSRTGV